jgi:hypothetical protein
MSGFTDAFYKENTAHFRDGHAVTTDTLAGGGSGGDSAISGGVDGIGDGDGRGSDDEAGDGSDGMDDDEDDDGRQQSMHRSELLLDSAYGSVETGESCQYWFKPCEVWEIRAADITISPVHTAGQGLVHPTRGMSLRFPRFVRKRTDKRVEHATTAQQLAAVFNAQAQRQ